MGNAAFMGGLTGGIAQGMERAQTMQMQREMQDMLKKEIKLKAQLQEIALDKALRQRTARSAIGLAQSGVGMGQAGGPEEFAAFGNEQVPFEALGQMAGGQAVVQKPPMTLADMAADAQMQKLLIEAGDPYEDIVKQTVGSDLAVSQFQRQMGALNLGGGGNPDYYPELSISDGKPGVRLRARDYEMVEVLRPDGSKEKVWVQKPGPGMPMPSMPAGPVPPAAGPAPVAAGPALPAVPPSRPGAVVTSPSPLDLPLGESAGKYVDAQGRPASATMTPRQASEAGHSPMSAGQEARAQAQAKADVESLATLPESMASAKDMLRQVDELINHPQLPRTVGPMGWMPAVPGLNSDAMERLKQLQGGVFLQAYQKLKGAGQITEVEGLKAEQALARLGRAQTLREMKTSLTELRSVVSGSLGRMEAKAKAGAPAGGTVNWEDLPE